MTSRDSAPLGAPCWTHLWTSDVPGSREFYAGLFGWRAEPPNPEFGGYFMFTRDGVPVAGAMGGMPGAAADDRWQVFLATDDIERTVRDAADGGADVAAPPMAVADLGVQAVLTDPTGGPVGAWQPGTFPGFTVLGEPGTPAWFELHTRDHGRAVTFYREAFRWETQAVGDTDDFRYTVMLDPGGGESLAGIFDARRVLAEGEPSGWSVYWTVADADAAVARVTSLGGSVAAPPEDTPYGRMATVADPAGAPFRLHQVRE